MAMSLPVRVCERFSVLWRRKRNAAAAPACHCCRRLVLALLLVALVVVHSRFTYVKHQKVIRNVVLLEKILIGPSTFFASCIVAAFRRQMNELELHKATRGTCHVLASLSFSLNS
jgi:hypothetical protein